MGGYVGLGVGRLAATVTVGRGGGSRTGRVKDAGPLPGIERSRRFLMGCYCLLQVVFFRGRWGGIDNLRENPFLHW